MSLVEVIADDVCEGVRSGKRRWVQAWAPSRLLSAAKCGDEVEVFPIGIQAYFPGDRGKAGIGPQDPVVRVEQGFRLDGRERCQRIRARGQRPAPEKIGVDHVET